jgi:hypothetical protein
VEKVTQIFGQVLKKICNWALLKSVLSTGKTTAAISWKR